MMHRRSGLLSLCALALFTLTSPAGAEFVTYTDRAAFLAAAPSVTTETFDEFPSQTNLPPQFVLDGVTYVTHSGPNQGWAVIAGGVSFPPESSPNILGGGSVTSLGLALITPDGTTAQSPAQYSVMIYETEGTVTTLSESFTVPGPHYLGFIESGATAGIAEVIIQPLVNSSNIEFNFGLDDVSHSAIIPGDFQVYDPYVPEPASLAMLGTGLVGVGLAAALMRRIRRR